MNMEGITALVAAGAAIVAVPATLIVGRLQYKGAIAAADRTYQAGIAQAEAASRTGIAQAEATYRAALDAVRASGAEAHTQWLRDIRRQSYSAFLLACSEVADVASKLALDTAKKRVPADQRDARREELAAAIARLENTVMIVDLEGPEAVSPLAELLASAVKGAAQECTHQCDLFEAWTDFTRFEEGPDGNTVRGYFQALLHLESIVPLTNEDPRRSNRMLSEVREALDHLDEERQRLPFAFPFSTSALEDYASGAFYRSAAAWSEKDTIAERAREEFIRTVRTVLGPSQTPAGT
ncbi:hypothetical protein [Streptomyces ardesiacus]|uniref:hypothetical protein n=1 Tax=Streptomyces ardesiacus TaxID=285564 RepID=UPI003F49D39E